MSKKILSINSGSSSLKFKLYEMPEETVLASGQVDRIGIENSTFSYKIHDSKTEVLQPIKDHDEAIKTVINMLLTSGVIQDKNEISGVGHRVSHGGRYYDKSVLIDEDVKKRIDELSVLSPLHNPVNLIGIKDFEKLLPDAKEVAIFDTSFHHTMPEEAYMYALPYEYYERYGVRRYGFHGPSHEYVYDQAVKISGTENNQKVITCHLGNGSSLCAIKDGKSINTSMGFTPLAGLVMGSRSGDVDPEILPFIEEELNMDSHAIREMLNKQSGLLGLSGISSDVRDVELAANEGNQRAQLAIKVFVHQIQHYIGAYAADLNGLDTLIFTAGIGEHSSSIRKAICAKLGYLGVEIDEEFNHDNMLNISSKGSKVKVLVIPTDEEIMIARDVMKVAKL